MLSLCYFSYLSRCYYSCVLDFTVRGFKALEEKLGLRDLRPSLGKKDEVPRLKKMLAFVRKVFLFPSPRVAKKFQVLDLDS